MSVKKLDDNFIIDAIQYQDLYTSSVYIFLKYVYCRISRKIILKNKCNVRIDNKLINYNAYACPYDTCFIIVCNVDQCANNVSIMFENNIYHHKINKCFKINRYREYTISLDDKAESNCIYTNNKYIEHKKNKIYIYYSNCTKEFMITHAKILFKNVKRLIINFDNNVLNNNLCIKNNTSNTVNTINTHIKAKTFYIKNLLIFEDIFISPMDNNIYAIGLNMKKNLKNSNDTYNEIIFLIDEKICRSIEYKYDNMKIYCIKNINNKDRIKFSIKYRDHCEIYDLEKNNIFTNMNIIIAKLHDDDISEDNLNEWIQHHKNMNFDYFIIYSNKLLVNSLITHAKIDKCLYKNHSYLKFYMARSITYIDTNQYFSNKFNFDETKWNCTSAIILANKSFYTENVINIKKDIYRDFATIDLLDESTYIINPKNIKINNTYDLMEYTKSYILLNYDDICINKYIKRNNKFVMDDKILLIDNRNSKTFYIKIKSQICENVLIIE